MIEALAGLCSEGRLRAAINTGNRALVQETPDGLAGVSPELARRLAAALDATLEPVVYKGAGEVVDDAASGRWDVAFVAVDPSRADRIAFTRPYVIIETTYAVRKDSPMTSVADADKPGTNILVGKNSAYDLYLSKTIEHATLVRAPNPSASMDLFLEGEGDAVGGVRQTLEAAFGEREDVRILPDAFHQVGQALALPLRHAHMIEALQNFLDDCKADGMIRAALDASGQGSLTIP